MAILLFAIAGYSQKFQGTATYEWKASSEEFRESVIQPDMDPKMKEFLEAKMKKMFQKTFVLKFDKNSSIYKQEQLLDVKGDNFVPDLSRDGAKIATFKNIQKRQLTTQKEFYGKNFTIEDSLPKLNWKLENETKQIGNYKCSKATAVIKLKQIEKKKEAERSTNFFEEKEMPTEKIITAWYASEIPVSQGPENYWGLPGLILELNDGNSVALCTKIVLNPKEKVVIEPLSKGTIVTQAAYDAIVIKKNKELEDQQ